MQLLTVCDASCDSCTVAQNPAFCTNCVVGRRLNGNGSTTCLLNTCIVVGMYSSAYISECDFQDYCPQSICVSSSDTNVVNCVERIVFRYKELIIS